MALEARGLTKRFPVLGGLMRRPTAWVRAVDRVTLTLDRGETRGVVGESGCGKTTLGRLVLGLLRPEEGEVMLDGAPLGRALRDDARGTRRRMQIIFQDPLDSLDPRWTIAQSIAEPLRACGGFGARELRRRVREALESVQLAEDLAQAYPHELSGGQRQRAGIARAVAVEPAYIVCDEPVSSLDLSIQAQVLDVLLRLQRERNIGYLFISHDLGVVEAVSRRVAVMYLGAVVELAPAGELLRRPWHPYTEALLAAVPRPDPDAAGGVQPLGGEPPSAAQLPSGCRFRTRCPLAEERCAREEPPLVEKEPGRFVACHFRP